VQYAEQESKEQEVSKENKVYIQKVLGTLFYYTRAVDSTMLVAFSAIASEQATPTGKTLQKIKQLFVYAASQEDAILTYHVSNMVLAVHSDTS